MSFISYCCDKQDINLFWSLSGGSSFSVSSCLLMILLCSNTSSGPTCGQVAELQKTLLQTTWNLYTKKLVDLRYRLSWKPLFSCGRKKRISWDLLSEERQRHFTSTVLAEHAVVNKTSSLLKENKRNCQKQLDKESMYANIFVY